MKRVETRSRLEWLLVAPWRLALLVAVTLSLPVFAVSESAVRRSEERLAEERHVMTAAAAVRAAELVDVWIGSLRQRVAAAVEIPDLKAATHVKDVVAMRALLLVELGRILPSGSGAKDVVGLTVADDEGIVVYGIRDLGQAAELTVENIADRDYFRALARHATGVRPVTAQDVQVTGVTKGSRGAPAVDATTGTVPLPGSSARDRIILAAPIRFGLDPLVGVLVVEIDPRSAHPFLRAPRGDLHDLYLTDRLGHLISRAGDPGYTARDLGRVPVVTAAIGGEEGIGDGTDPITGALGIVATARVPSNDWVVLAVRTPAAADEAATLALQQQRLSGGGLAVALVVGSLLVGISSSRSIRRRDALAESLEQQAALSGILRTITANPGRLEPVLDAIAQNAVRFCAAEGALMHLVETKALRIVAESNWSADPAVAEDQRKHPEASRGRRLPLDRGTIVGAAVLDQRTTQVADLEATTDYPASRQFAANLGFRAMLTSPIRRGDEVVGALSIRRVAPGNFSQRDMDLADAFAVHAGLAIENARLFTETKEALEQQTAIGDVLKAISSSVFDLEAVLRTIAARARVLCEADACSVWRVIDDHRVERLVREGAGQLAIPGEGEPGLTSEIVDRDSPRLVARATRTLTPHRVDDARQHPELPQGDALARLAVPIVKHGQAIGALLVTRLEPREFSDGDAQLLQTFADQAGIAMENVRLFREIQDKSAQLEDASRHKSEFLANMSHELRTPLNAIIGFSDVMLEGMAGQLDKRVREYADDIRSSGHHLLSLINDVLDLSKVEAGRMELDLAEVALDGAVDEALAFVRERAARHGITLANEVPPDLPLLTADPRKVKQVLVNLLSNAVKFTPEGGWVGITVGRDGDEVAIAVRDTGVGIAPEDQARIFEEFRQARRSDGRTAEGTGLGLTLTRRFVELHGGRITVASDVGKGSTFTVHLPLRQPATTAAVVAP